MRPRLLTLSWLPVTIRDANANGGRCGRSLGSKGAIPDPHPRGPRCNFAKTKFESVRNIVSYDRNLRRPLEIPNSEPATARRVLLVDCPPIAACACPRRSVLYRPAGLTDQH
jgi:hypothetical protein